MLPLSAATLAGCGYAASGTWDDDPGNWERAFHSARPPDVVVVRSRYRRSPHWTLEYEYFFHVRANDALRRQLFEENELVRVEGDPLCDVFSERPDWFLPGGADDVEAWRLAEPADSRFRVFVDPDTGDLFLTDNQI